MRFLRSVTSPLAYTLLLMAACCTAFAQTPVVPLASDPDPMTLTAAGCIKDAAGTALQSGTFNLQIVDGNGTPASVTDPNISSLVTTSTVQKTVTSGVVSATTIPNPANTSLTPYLLHISIIDGATGKITNYPKLQVMLNDVPVSGRFTQFNLCKANVSLATNAAPVNYVVGPAGATGAPGPNCSVSSPPGHCDLGTAQLDAGAMNVTNIASTGNVALKAGIHSAIRFITAISDGGSDANDGRDVGDGKAYWTSAYIDILQSNPGFGGTIYVSNNGTGTGAGCAPPGAAGALWIAGPFDPGWAVLTASSVSNGNGTSTLTVTAVGSNVGASPTLAVGENLTDGGTANIPYSQITAFQSGTGTTGTYTVSGNFTFASQTVFAVPPGFMPEQRITTYVMVDGHYINSRGHGATLANCAAPEIWVTGTNMPVSFYNLGVEPQGAAVRVGIDSNNLASGHSTSRVNFFQGFARVLGTDPTSGPAMEVGGQADVVVDAYGINANTSLSKPLDGSDSAQAVVLHAGAIFQINKSEVDYGGIKIYDAGAAYGGPWPGSVNVTDLKQQFNMDGKGVVWYQGGGGAPGHWGGFLHAWRVFTDSPTAGLGITSIPAVEVDVNDSAPWMLHLDGLRCYADATHTCNNFVGPFQAGEIDTQFKGPQGVQFGIGGNYGPNSTDSSGNTKWGLLGQTGNAISYQCYGDCQFFPDKTSGPANSATDNFANFSITGHSFIPHFGSYGVSFYTFSTLPVTCDSGHLFRTYAISDSPTAQLQATVTAGAGSNDVEVTCSTVGNWTISKVYKGNSPTSGVLIPSWCPGTVGTAATTYFLQPGNGSASCTNTQAAIMPIATQGTITSCYVNSGTVGAVAGSGAIAFVHGIWNGTGFDNTVTPICTLGTAKTCSNTSMSISIGTGTGGFPDGYYMQVTTAQATDTTANIRVSCKLQ